LCGVVFVSAHVTLFFGEMMSQDLTTQQQLVLERTRWMLDAKEKTRDALDAKAATILQSSSLVIVLTGAVGISTMATEYASSWMLGVVVFAFFVFLLMLICALWAWKPSVHSLPGSTDWDTLYNDYINEDADTCFSKVLSDTLNSIEKNHKYNEQKSRLVSWAGWLFAAQVAGILIAAGVIAYLPR
jgi:hypothetical protein